MRVTVSQLRAVVAFVSMAMVLGVYRSWSTPGGGARAPETDVWDELVEAVIVPGGGQLADGPPEHMKLRLDGAAKIWKESPDDRKPKIILLSGGTPHKPNPLDEHGFDVKECECSARYLMHSRGVPPSDIREEGFSLDTLGNAFYARTLHCDPAGYRNVAIVNNWWHIPRTKKIFSWIFSLTPVAKRPYNLRYVEVAEGLDQEILKIRLEKEKQAAPGVNKLVASMSTLAEFHQWLFTSHGAYKTERLLKPRQTIDPKLAKSY
eukprot:Rhum_TRINITY_DN10849_c1_g1::Rhum_TRINITY_DN10849_c1_g1_i1::g.40745::m.40745